MTKVRVLVVDDSATVRARICELLASDPGIEVVGTASDGRQAVEMCRVLRPDVVTLDMVLPVMTGVDATEHIMAHFPTPILIVSSSVNRGELFDTYDALAAGAVDVLDKPKGDELDEEWARKLVSTVKLLARIRVITHPRARLGALGKRTITPAPVDLQIPPGVGRAPRILAIGASTGGPGALVTVLRSLPPPFPFPILVVLHIGKPFGIAFPEWLEQQTSHRVTNARDGEPLSSLDGRVIMAPPGCHLAVQGGALRLTQDAERHSCRPSVDVLFESLAREMGSRVIACLLTGMGRDGAAGLLEIRKAGGATIVQDEATCVVYGMPREAVAMGAAERVVPLGDIGATIAAIVREGERVKQ